MVRANRRIARRRRGATAIKQLTWRLPVNPFRPTEVLNPDQLEAVHGTSLQVLEDLGIEFMSAEALDVRARGGAQVDRDSGLVRFDRGLIAELLGKAPARVTVTPRDPARRLIEAGVRFFTINTFLTVFDEITWDIHGSKPFTSIDGMRKIVAPMYDQAYSALIEDLSQRGMLDKTMVACLAEFGRTPKVNPAGGRDHWPQCFSCTFAGGGVQGGRVVGQSDPMGGVPADRPTDPPEIVATIFHGLGLDVETLLPGPAGRPFPLVDSGKHEIKELFWDDPCSQESAVHYYYSRRYRLPA